jgi:hypothetical protein
LKAAAAVACAVAAGSLMACARKAQPADPVRMATLQRTYDHLHERLEKASATEPLVASAFAARGQVVVAIRSGLIEELAGNVAQRYLDRVTVNLSGIEAHKTGELRRKTFLGRIKLGEWSVSVAVGDLSGDLSAGTPRVGLRRPDLIDVELPLDVQETEGEATLRLAWDSSALANVVCKDFEMIRELRGRVPPQHHVLTGALRIENTGESLTVTPVFPDRDIQLQLDLTKQSWAVVEAALRSQDTLGKCGLVMHPDRGLVKLHELAARGIKVHLPDSVFRTVSLPARMQKSVKVNESTVGLALKAESLRIETATLWSSVSVQVQGQTKP